MRPEAAAPLLSEAPLADWPARAIGAIADGVVVGIVTYAIATAAGIRLPTAAHRLNGFVYVDLAVSFVYSFTMIALWGRTLGMAMMRLYAVDAVEGRTPIAWGRAAIRSFMAGVFYVVAPVAVLDVLWPLWDPRNQTIHDKAAGTVVLRRVLPD